jgi:peptidoglycan/xylan/chitin deacetylase (PgdA/CDA1 family)
MNRMNVKDLAKSIKKKGNLTIIMYHYVRPIKNSKFPRIKGLEFSSFKKQLDYLSKNYTFITPGQLIESLLGRENLPKNACHLTFDDGFKDHVKYVMPELLIRNIHGSFFISTNAIEKRELLEVNAIHFILASSKNIDKLLSEINSICLDLGLTKSKLNFLFNIYGTPLRYANGNVDSAKTIYCKRMLQVALPKEIRSLIIRILFKKYLGKNTKQFAQDLYMSLSDIKKLIKNGMYVGSHGHKHIWLGKTRKSEQIKEINSSISFLKKVGVRTNNWMMSYPYGSYNKETLKILREKNCLIGLTTKAGISNLNPAKLLELSRYDTNDFPQ